LRILGAVLLALGALGSLGMPPISAQTVLEDPGYRWVRIGLGPGWSLLRMPPPEDVGPPPGLSIVEEERLLGIGGFASFASSVNAHLAIGVELNGWTGVEDGAGGNKSRRSQLGVYAVAHVFPFEGGRFFLEGGLGVGGVVIDSLDGGRGERGVNLGYLIGSGYDIPGWGETVITPYLEVSFVGRFRGEVPNVINLGIALGLAH